MQPEIIPQMGPRDVDWLKVALVDRSGDLGGGPEVLAAPNVAIGGVAMEKNCAETCLVALSTNRPEKEHRIVSSMSPVEWWGFGGPPRGEPSA